MGENPLHPLPVTAGTRRISKTSKCFYLKCILGKRKRTPEPLLWLPSFVFFSSPACPKRKNVPYSLYYEPATTLWSEDESFGDLLAVLGVGEARKALFLPSPSSVCVLTGSPTYSLLFHLCTNVFGAPSPYLLSEFWQFETDRTLFGFFWGSA